MKIALLLLSKDNCYSSLDNKLPNRPDFDKNFLTNMIKNKSVSAEGYKLLPKSMQDIVKISDINIFPIKIREISQADLLIVSRSEDILKGNIFRLDKFELILKYGQLEFWKKL